MNIQPISTKCEKAVLTHFCLEMESWEIESLSEDPDAISDDLQEGHVRLQSRDRILRLGERFLKTTLDDCEACEYYDPENPDPCPNIDTLGFIRDTLTK